MEDNMLYKFLGAIIFDLDGTLIDSMTQHRTTFSNILSENFRIPKNFSEEIYMHTAGKPLDEQFEIALHEFEIQNNSSSTLSLDKLYTSCMCTGAYFVSAGDRIGPFGMPGHGFVPGLGQRMEAGEKAKIEVVFDPAAHGPAGVGPIVRGIYLESAGSVKEFGIKAVVIP